jgi:mono/diheme cytochrome c family protein
MIKPISGAGIPACRRASARRAGRKPGGSPKGLPHMTASILLLAGAALAAEQPVSPQRALLDRYCVTCHNEKAKTAGLMLDKLDVTHPGANPETWEKVVRKVRAGMMPPSGAPRPDRAQLDTFAAKLEADLDRAGAQHPNPGTTGLHRLNRVEYANAIRDLLALDVDTTTLLPADDSSEGFDNIADALSISPALIERYAAAAVKISRLAVGDPLITPSTVTYRVSSDLVQGEHIEGLPLGTRGGILIHHTFPLDAEYNFKIRAKAANIGLGSTTLQGEELEVTVNGERVKLVPAVASLDLKLAVKAGPATVGVAFVRKPPPGADEIWQIFPNNSGVTSVAIIGPLNPNGPGESPSRRRIFTCRPATEAEEPACAKKILAALAQRAYRQPPTGTDLDTLLSFYQTGRKDGTFDYGIEQAVARLLVDPRFVFRLERNPENVADGAAYHVSDLELASRLSFFLWSSIPDDELLNVAIQGKLHEPAVLEAQARRMLADPRSEALVTNFGGQWLYLRELKNARPEAREFNDNLRQSFRRETELFLDSIVRGDRNVTDLLTANYTFVDETLARHYGIPNVHGSRFRQVAVPDDARRGLLGQASFLLVTSVANRTSPVARGKWILENLLGTPPPLPPPNVPPLKESDNGQQPTSLRQKMEEHRQNPVCSACHKIMDPIGFSLENFDLIGRWRSAEGDAKIDASGRLVDGTKLDGPASLRQALLSRSDVFVQTMTEKLLIYATGRALKYYDMPVVRAISHGAARSDNRFSSLILGIVKSDPFQMKVKQAGGKA